MPPRVIAMSPEVGRMTLESYMSTPPQPLQWKRKQIATTSVEERADPLMVEPPMFEGADVDMQGPSLHTIKEKAVTAVWNKVHPALLKSAEECNAMPTTQCCILCPSNAMYRCIQCAPYAYFCQSCFCQSLVWTSLHMH